MQIPKIDVIITQGNRTLALVGSIDTGYDGFAVVRPSVQSRLNMPIIGSMQLLGFGGKLTVPVAKADSISIKGSPACVSKNAQVTISEIPGNGPEDILFGEKFFKQFNFDINYREGQPLVIACDKKVETISSTVSDFLEPITSSIWFVPAVTIGVIGLASFAYLLLSEPTAEDMPARYR